MTINIGSVIDYAIDSVFEYCLSNATIGQVKKYRVLAMYSSYIMTTNIGLVTD